MSTSRKVTTTLCLALIIEAIAASPTARGQTETRLEVNSYSQIGFHYAESVAIQGDTAVVGVPWYYDDLYQEGAAYVYVRVGTTWLYEATLVPADPGFRRQFGESVGIDGNTIVVGTNTDNEFTDQAAYVFVRTGNVWSQQAKLTPSDGLLGDDFGLTVSISADTILVGAPFADVAGVEIGCAYVFVRSGTIWTEQSKLVASDAGFLDQFGSSVEIDGETAVIGAPRDDVVQTNQGSAYVFVRSGATWSQQEKFVAVGALGGSEFGAAVSVDGDTVAVATSSENGPGGIIQRFVYVFIRSSGIWNQQAKLSASDASVGDFDLFGSSVSVDSETLVVGSRLDDGAGGTDQGSAYVFTRTGITWSEQDKVTAPDAAADDYFGSSVAVDRDTVIAGAFSNDTNEGHDEGTAYVYVRSDSSWSHQTTLALFSGDLSEGDEFGRSVAMSGDTAVIGAHDDAINGREYQGSALVFVYNGMNWVQQAKLTASDGAAGDEFGISVAISGDTVVVGANRADGASATDCGAAYVFQRNGGTWMQEAKLTPSVSQTGETFGTNVAIVNGTIVVGAPFYDGPAGFDQGRAFVFVRSGNVWSQQAELKAPDAGQADRFGYAVTIDGDTLVVSSPNDMGAQDQEGSVHVFTRSGTIWSWETELTDPNPSSHRHFGFAIAIRANRLAAGAPGDQIGGGLGRVHLFSLSGGVWTHEALVTTPDGASQDFFGRSVALLGERLLVGAEGADGIAGVDQGSAYVFRKGVSGWSEEMKLTASDAAAGDSFGVSVALFGARAIVGAYLVGGKAGPFQGAAYVYELPCLTNADCDDGDACTTDDVCDTGSSTCYSVECEPLADPSNLNKTRFVSFSVPPSATATAGETALRVKLVSLHRVVPPYTGGASVPFTSFEGQVRWVGPPGQYVESNANPVPFYAARLQCTPYYQDWSTVGLLHVTGSAIVPSSVYEVENVAASCMGIEDTCTAVSAPLTVSTTRWGDVEQPYNPPDGSVQPDLADVGALVNKFRSAQGAPIKARALLAGDDSFGNISANTMSLDFNFSHIAACVDAFRGKPYPFAIEVCP